MSAVTDLETLLATLSPQLDPQPYKFAALTSGDSPPEGVTVLASFAEAEGMSLIVPASADLGDKFASSANCARLTMSVHSSFEAVGMTAAIAAALTQAGIGANVVAAYHHDHVFVPWGRRFEAMEVIEALARRHRSALKR